MSLGGLEFVLPAVTKINRDSMQSDTVRLLRRATPYKSQLGGALVVALFGAALEVARPWPTKAIVDYALSGQALPHWLAALSVTIPSLATRTGIIFWSVVVAAFLALRAAAA